MSYSRHGESSDATAPDPYLLVEKCGSRRGEPIYIVTKYIPSGNRAIPDRSTSIRCMDLGREALGNYKAEEGGCTQTQFFNDTQYFKCAKCGNEFSKFYLRKDLFIEVRGLPE